MEKLNYIVYQTANKFINIIFDRKADKELTKLENAYELNRKIVELKKEFRPRLAEFEPILKDIINLVIKNTGEFYFTNDRNSKKLNASVNAMIDFYAEPVIGEAITPLFDEQNCFYIKVDKNGASIDQVDNRELCGVRTNLFSSEVNSSER